jgi:hypothetical protein
MDCDAPIRTGARCQICRLEHQHGTLSDWEDDLEQSPETRERYEEAEN